MMAADPIERALAELHALCASSLASSAARDALRKALSNKTNLIAAKAAEIAGEHRVMDLADDVAAMFRRFMPNASKADKGCVGKTAAAKALYAMGADDAELFLAGVRHHQPEASWGKPVDTAVELRGICSIALVRMRHRDAIVETIPLLADEDPQARLAGVRAIAYDEGPAAVPLLRYKALLGDDEPEVVGECLVSLMRLSPESSLPFVDGFLSSPEAQLREIAAVALAQSRQPVALAMLRQRWQQCIDPEIKQTMLSAIALMRTEPALEFLIDRIVSDNRTSAIAAVVALAPSKRDPSVRQRVAGAVAERDEGEVTRAFERHFS